MCVKKTAMKCKAIITPMYSPQRYNVEVFNPNNEVILAFDTKYMDVLQGTLIDFGDTNNLDITTEWSEN